MSLTSTCLAKNFVLPGWSLIGKNVRIESVPASTPVFVTADASQLDQILLKPDRARA